MNARSPDKWRTAAFFSIVLSCGYCFVPQLWPHALPADWFPPFQSGVTVASHTDLGAEYRNIARSLRSHGTFADPFACGGGPTAWMPPAIPVLLSGLLWLFADNETLVAAFLVVLKASLLCWICWDAFESFSKKLPPALIAGCLGVSGIALASELFQTIHDGWLLLPVMHLLMRKNIRLNQPGEKAGTVNWGLFGGLCALCSPAIFFSWIVASIRFVGRGRVAWTSIIVAAAVTVPWMTRTYRLIGVVAPIKSNFWFDFNQALETKYGLPDQPAFMRHPCNNANAARVHAEIGEAEFVRQAKHRAFERLRKEGFSRYLSHLSNRFLAAILVRPPMRKLESGDLWYWVSAACYALPFICLVFSLSLRPRLYPGESSVIAIGSAYLLPYILASFYLRYAVPLFSIRVFILLWSCCRLVDAFASEGRLAPDALDR